VSAFSLQDKDRPRSDPDGRRRGDARAAKKVVSSRMTYPGYVLVEMDLDEKHMAHRALNAARHRLCRLRDRAHRRCLETEVDAIINRVHVPTDRPKPKVVFPSATSKFRIVDGPFRKFQTARSKRSTTITQPAEGFRHDFLAARHRWN